MKFRLRVFCGHDAGASFLLEDGQELWVGRGIECGARLNDPAVSRTHCRIVIENGQATLYDAESRWGTFVEDEPVERRALQPGERILVGETELLLEREATPADTTLAKPLVSPDARPLDAWPHEKHEQAEVLGEPTPRGRQPRGAAPFHADFAGLAGTRFARFQVESIVARAQTGVVFRASDTDKGRTVALKVFYPENFHDAHNMRRFLRAVRTMLPIKHENLVTLYRAGRSRGLCYTACEFVEGENAAQLIQRTGISGMLQWQHAFRLAVHVARALEVAEQHGIIHRNITPRNILIRSSDRLAKLGDLVLTRAMEGTRREQITRPGELVGQLEYLSPEQTTGARPIDNRSDIYSLGATLYAVLTGRPPFEGRTAVETILKIQIEEPVKPTQYHLSIPSLFEDVVVRMLAKRPEDRFQTPTSLLKDLDHVAKYQGICLDDQ